MNTATDLPHEFRLRSTQISDLAVLQRIDDEAGSLFATVGIHFQLPPSHPFVCDELRRWRVAIQAGGGFVAVTPLDVAAGFVLLGEVDGAPYLEQVCVAPAFMGRGIGRALVRRAIAEGAGKPLCLTTYAHVPWNAPFYVGLGFRQVPEEDCGREVLQLLAQQREALPFPGERIAMVRPAT